MLEGCRLCAGEQWDSGQSNKLGLWFMSLLPDAVVGWGVSVASWSYGPLSATLAGGGGGEAVRVMSLLGQSVNRHEKVAVDMASASDGETCCLGASQPAGAGVWGAGSPHAVVGWTTRLSLQSWAGQGSL